MLKVFPAALYFWPRCCVKKNCPSAGYNPSHRQVKKDKHTIRFLQHFIPIVSCLPGPASPTASIPPPAAGPRVPGTNTAIPGKKTATSAQASPGSATISPCSVGAIRSLSSHPSGGRLAGVATTIPGRLSKQGDHRVRLPPLCG
jgi:hypothetical protein